MGAGAFKAGGNPADGVALHPGGGVEVNSC